MSYATHRSLGGSNAIAGSGSTNGATTDDVITVNLGSSSLVREIRVSIAGYGVHNISSAEAGAGYELFGAVRTDGATATLLGTPDRIANEEAAMLSATANLVVSGNDAIVRVTGVTDYTIQWKAILTYVSAP